MSWFETPEAQPDPHYWAATLAGHALLGVLAGVVAGFLGSALLGALLALSYMLLWEVLQFLRSERKRSLLWDCILDGAAFCLGTISGLAAWTHDFKMFAGCALALGAVAASGVFKRS